jgi:hypothetical protein
MEGYVRRTLPLAALIFKAAGAGFEGSASPGVIEAVIEPELVVREIRSRWVKVPAMALEVVWRIVRREVQCGRVMGREVVWRFVRLMLGWGSSLLCLGLRV